jgi:hypothetical protein
LQALRFRIQHEHIRNAVPIDIHCKGGSAQSVYAYERVYSFSLENRRIKKPFALCQALTRERRRSRALHGRRLVRLESTCSRVILVGGKAR